LTETSASKINFLFFYKIVYKVPFVPIAYDEKLVKKEVGPIEFRLTYLSELDKKKRTVVPYSMAISGTLGEKRSVFHHFTITDKPFIYKFQF
jgi:hypothetical protein